MQSDLTACSKFGRYRGKSRNSAHMQKPLIMTHLGNKGCFAIENQMLSKFMQTRLEPDLLHQAHRSRQRRAAALARR